jgi:Eco57I restriction-modification methylase
MLAGLSGTLISQFFAEEILLPTFAGQLGETTRAAAHAALAQWWKDTGAALGPAASTRTLWDCGVVPTLRLLGYDTDEGSSSIKGLLTGTSRAPEVTFRVVVGPWNGSLDRIWRLAAGQDHTNLRWWICFNGSHLRLVDSVRTYADSYLEFDLEVLSADVRSFAVFWAILRATVFLRTSRAHRPHELPLFDQFVCMSAAHATGVCRSLQRGVLEALSELVDCLSVPARAHRRRGPPSRDTLSSAFQGSLTAIYRVLFLLFAEARGLVPIWHPIYRDSYTIESLRVAIERSARPRGLWESLQAIARLAREGCAAGDLRVTPFNGRLFAPVPSIDASRPLHDEAVRRALLALSTTPAGSGGRHRIDYRDLGVEQLGAVYEAVLDYEPAWDRGPHPSVRLRKGSRERKVTGTFYTPRSITEYVVRRTLHPLVHDAPAEAVLRLRVLDPAMGSAAFLVAACRYLARAYEAALVRDGACAADDISESDRCSFRRTIAQRCLFGVDRNPMAVQLARLSLWLATLAGDRPLTFLDHHLRVGNSLVGATPADLARRAPPRSSLRRAPGKPPSLPFFEESDLTVSLRSIVPNRVRIAVEPGDTLAAVREKERLLQRVSSSSGTLERWRTVADLWCACWFWPDDASPSPQTFAALADHEMGRLATLPRPLVDRLLQTVRAITTRERFFHWILEFPEAFYDPDGEPVAQPGFDAVLGNPPWDMLRADPGLSSERRAANQHTRFIKDSGAYQVQSTGHVNLYQAFLERAVRLARFGGRIGIVLPSGVLTDHGAAPIRRLLFHHCDTDSLVVFENRAAVFPIHRSMKFVLLTSTTGGETTDVCCRIGERDVTILDALDAASTASFPVRLTRRFIERTSGAGLAVPEVRTASEAALLDHLNERFGPLSAADGWNCTFGRELNATDDSRHFTESVGGLPVLEGKQIEPFRVCLETCRRWIPEAMALRLLGKSAAYQQPRLAYREVAGVDNRLTLIAAIVPGYVVTTHSLFCLKTPASPIEQAFLCGVLNSFVANFLVRLFVTTHVTAATIGRLRVPQMGSDDPLFREIAALAARLSQQDGAWPRHYAQLQAFVAHAYELDEARFRHILSTFPLIDAAEREEAVECFLTSSVAADRSIRRTRGGPED